MQRLKNYLRPFMSWKFLLCFFLAWLVTNGWSYIFIIIGTTCDINWMLNTALSYQAFLWMPFTPEKLVTIPMAMWFNAKMFKDEKTHNNLTKMKEQALKDWHLFKNGPMLNYTIGIFTCAAACLLAAYVVTHPMRWYVTGALSALALIIMFTSIAVSIKGLMKHSSYKE